MKTTYLIFTTLIFAILLLFLARHGFAQPFFSGYLDKMVVTDLKKEYTDLEMLGIRIYPANIFTVEAKDHERKIYARYICHLRCMQTDLFVEENGTGGFVKQKTEDTSRIETAGKP